MRSTGGGYTIIEVLIFLGVSALLLVAALIAVGGQQGHTEFSTATNDVNTKIQQWIDQVVNGYSGSTAEAGASTFRCTVSAGRPVLSGGSAERGANPQCVFMGKAIQVNEPGGSQNPSKIYTYSVLGSRIGSDGELAANLLSAGPTAAVFKSIPGGDLTEEYLIPNGARVKWVRNGTSLTSLTGNSHMAGFFTSFNSGSSSQNGSQSLIAVQYPLNSNADGDAEGGTAVRCISLDPAVGCDPFGLNPSNPWPMNRWVICLESTRNNDTAAISVISTVGQGASTKVTIPCPGS